MALSLKERIFIAGRACGKTWPLHLLMSEGLPDNLGTTVKIDKMKEYDELLAILEDAKADFEKFYDKGNAAAGTRVRKAMMNVKNKAQEIRGNVSDIKNG